MDIDSVIALLAIWLSRPDIQLSEKTQIKQSINRTPCRRVHGRVHGSVLKILSTNNKNQRLVEDLAPTHLVSS